MDQSNCLLTAEAQSFLMKVLWLEEKKKRGGEKKGVKSGHQRYQRLHGFISEFIIHSSCFIMFLAISLQNDWSYGGNFHHRLRTLPAELKAFSIGHRQQAQEKAAQPWDHIWLVDVGFRPMVAKQKPFQIFKPQHFRPCFVFFKHNLWSPYSSLLISWFPQLTEKSPFWCIQSATSALRAAGFEVASHEPGKSWFFFAQTCRVTHRDTLRSWWMTLRCKTLSRVHLQKTRRKSWCVILKFWTEPASALWKTDEKCLRLRKESSVVKPQQHSQLRNGTNCPAPPKKKVGRTQGPQQTKPQVKFLCHPKGWRIFVLKTQ